LFTDQPKVEHAISPFASRNKNPLTQKGERNRGATFIDCDLHEIAIISLRNNGALRADSSPATREWISALISIALHQTSNSLWVIERVLVSVNVF
jgi:hypothetical protein